MRSTSQISLKLFLMIFVNDVTFLETATGLDLNVHKEANEKYVASTDEVFLTIIKRVQNIFYYNKLLWNCSSLKKRQDEAIKYAHSIVNNIKMLTIVAILICTLLALYWKLDAVNSSREPPRLPGGLPLIGHALMFIGDTKHFWNIIREVSKICTTTNQALTLHIGHRKLYVITDPDDLLNVANSCLQKDVIYDFAKSYFGNGLVTAKVPIWKQHRKLLNPVFKQKHILDFLGVFNRQARNLVKLFAVETNRESFDHDPYIRHIAMESICYTAFGLDFSKNTDVNARYRHASEAYLKMSSERFLKVWLHNDFIWNLTSDSKTQDMYLKELHSISNMILQKRKKAFHTNEVYNSDFTGKKFKPFLDLLFELNNFCGEEIFSDKVIREHVDTFIVAGYDTVAVTLVYTLLLIGSYPDVQTKIYSELREVFGDSERDVTKEDLPRLVYLEAVFKESMRIYPVVPAVARTIDKDIKLKNYTLYAGNTCVFMITGVHTHPMWGEDAEQFRPERWLDQSTLPQNPNAFLAFSLGKRVCIGKTYAMYFMKTVMSHVLRHYNISGNHHKMINKFDVMLRPVTGHFISIQQRLTTS